MKKIYPIVLFVTILFSFSLGIFLSNGFNPNMSEPISEGLKYEGVPCISTTGDFEGRKTPSKMGIMELVGCTHNLIFNDGLNYTRNALASGGLNFTMIQLCNATGLENCTAPNANPKVQTFMPYTTCGLNNQSGTVLFNTNNGNWSISTTFTASCDNLVVNQTRLQNASNYNFSGASFTSVTLQTNDQILVNWTIQVS